MLELAKRRGFFWQAYEIYQGLAGLYDYGPLGAVLKRNIENAWREFYRRLGFHEIETPCIAPEEVFRASGHLEHFSDLLASCRRCGAFQDPTKLAGESKSRIPEIMKSLRCPECGGDLELLGSSSLMLSTRIGIQSPRLGYLRPETAQGMFVNFRRLMNFVRNKLPAGFMQIGKCFRNEISPRGAMLRLREFTIAEVEIFVDPRTNPKLEDSTLLRADGELVKPSQLAQITNPYLVEQMVRAQEFLQSLGIPPERMRFRRHSPQERAHYAQDCWDLEVLTSQGWIEVAGIANRTDYDLRSHAAFSNQDFRVFIPYSQPRKHFRYKLNPNFEAIKQLPNYSRILEAISNLDQSKLEQAYLTNRIKIELSGESLELDSRYFKLEREEQLLAGEYIVPHVIEPSFGIDRILYCIMDLCFQPQKLPDGQTRIVLKLPPKLAPIKLAVLPLVNHPKLVEKSKELYERLRMKYPVDYDDSGSIGRRYRRQDEIGTPYCITIDFQSLEDDTITIRDRDTMNQIRIGISQLEDHIDRILQMNQTANAEHSGSPDSGI